MPYINQYLLADPRLYRELLNQVKLILTGESPEINDQKLKQISYASWQQRHYYWPDQVFHGHWINFSQRKKEESGWCNAILSQAARYHFVDDSRRLAIKSSKFDQWQSWIANQTGLPVIAYQLTKQLDNTYFENPNELYTEIKSKLGLRALVSPYHPLVEDYIKCNGLHETHMHLNGTTLLEQLWNHALTHPDEIMESLTDEYEKNDRVKLLYASSPHLSEPKEFYTLLKYARKLREFLLASLESNYLDLDGIKIDLYNLLNNNETDTLDYPHEKKQFKVKMYWTHIAEVHWQSRIQVKLRDNPDPVIDSCYLLYLLCMNCYQRLLVQRSDQYGFDQFQKFADDGVRDNIEFEYEARFYQLHGPYITGKSDLSTLEGRFAPKRTMDNNINILQRMLVGYLRYAEGARAIDYNLDLNCLAGKVLRSIRPKFRLVAHFIKQHWSPLSGEYHYKSLRESLIEQCELLNELLNENHNLKQLITGIDAAANELEAPPEVFSSFYRFCHFKGFKNYTYHVGEDFEHLIGGIRAVFDAVMLLDLKNGDRIGHATAIGICPNIWLAAMPEKIYIRKGEWLDNLLFLRKIILSGFDIKLSISWVENQINKVYFDIYNEKVDLFILQDSFEYRGLAPDIVKDYLVDDTLAKTGWLRSELQLVSKVNKDTLYLLEKRWYDKSVLNNGDKLLDVNLGDITSETIIKVQQYVQKIIVNKHVVIETLPTSNVRISHYKSVSEHHIFRWLGVPSRQPEGDQNMLITLGSDDPGIFATDMRNEFYHLFGTLRHEFSYSPHEALSLVARLNENGRIYHFENDFIEKNYVPDGMSIIKY